MLFFKNKQKEIVEKELSDFKNKHVGQRCFIIGNGPSLRMEDLDKLKNEVTFAVNRIYLSFTKTDWRPTYYAIQDSKMIDQYFHDVENLPVKYKFIPSYMKDKFLNKTGNVYYYNYRLRLFDGTTPLFSDDIAQQTYEGGTVTYLCMQLATYMGFKEIYLIGNDFTYSLEKTNEGIKVNNVKDYFVDNYIGSTETRFYPRLDLCEEAFRFAKQTCDEKGITIYNATRGGKLEVFPRVDFDTISFK